MRHVQSEGFSPLFPLPGERAALTRRRISAVFLCLFAAAQNPRTNKTAYGGFKFTMKIQLFQSK